MCSQDWEPLDLARISTYTIRSHPFTVYLYYFSECFRLSVYTSFGSVCTLNWKDAIMGLMRMTWAVLSYVPVIGKSFYIWSHLSLTVCLMIFRYYSLHFFKWNSRLKVVKWLGQGLFASKASLTSTTSLSKVPRLLITLRANYFMRGLSTSHVLTNRKLTENTPLLIRPGKTKAEGVGAT